MPGWQLVVEPGSCEIIKKLTAEPQSTLRLQKANAGE